MQYLQALTHKIMAPNGGGEFVPAAVVGRNGTVWTIGQATDLMVAPDRTVFSYRGRAVTHLSMLPSRYELGADHHI